MTARSRAWLGRGGLFAPVIWRLAARLEQFPAAELLQDPTRTMRALQGAAMLLSADVVINAYEPTFLAEALGCGVAHDPDAGRQVTSHPFSHPAADWWEIEDLMVLGRRPVAAVLQLTQQLGAVVGGGRALLGLVPGPFLLARQLGGEAAVAGWATGAEAVADRLDIARGAIAQVVSAYCDLGVDGVWVAEDLAAVPVPAWRTLAGPLQSLHNITEYYQLPLILDPRLGAAPAYDELGSLPGEAIVLPAAGDPAALASFAERSGKRIGVALPVPALAEGGGEGVEWVRACRRGGTDGMFLTTAGDVPPGTRVEALQAIRSEWRQG